MQVLSCGKPLEGTCKKINSRNNSVLCKRNPENREKILVDLKDGKLKILSLLLYIAHLLLLHIKLLSCLVFSRANLLSNHI